MIRLENDELVIARSFVLAGLELTLLILLIFSFGSLVLGGVGGNVTVTTTLQVANVPPQIFNVSLNDDNPITLIANTTQSVSCVALVADYDNDTNISSANAVLFDNTFSTYGSGDDNNTHYTNSSCYLNLSFGTWKGYPDDNYTALAQCNFDIYYYANPGEWNCTVQVIDNTSLSDTNWDNETINDLLAVGVQDTIDYGVVNATFVSDQQTVNVTNVGNVDLNLSLYGYGYTVGDGNAMNCTLGNIKNITIENERYNLTNSTTGFLNLTYFQGNYTNVTGSAITRDFNVTQRQNDTQYGIDDTKSSYWRIYVPTGVAGTCQGNLVFGATQSNGQPYP